MDGGTFEERAGIVMRDFASEYKTFRNPDGKERVQVYGGIWWQRDAVVEALNRNIPSGVEVFVYEALEIIDDDRYYYVSAVEFCSGVRIPEAA